MRSCSHCGGHQPESGDLVADMPTTICKCRPEKCEKPLNLRQDSDQACFCRGPQGNDPVCPCRMRGVTIKDGRYVEVRDLGAVPPR